jgi:hypothetical protein
LWLWRPGWPPWGDAGPPASRGAYGPRPKGPPVTFDEVQWLIGTWRGTSGGPGSRFFYTYRRRDDSTLVATHFSNPACTLANPVTSTIEARGGRVYEVFGPDRWLVTRESPTTLVLYPVDDARVLFRWTLKGSARWAATVVQSDGVSEIRRTFTLDRLDAAPTLGTPQCVAGAAGAPATCSRLRR